LYLAGVRGEEKGRVIGMHNGVDDGMKVSAAVLFSAACLVEERREDGAFCREAVELVECWDCLGK